MDKEHLNKLRLPVPDIFKPIFISHEEDDEHGHYETGFFRYKGKEVFVNIEEGLWHLSVSAKHTLGYYELKEIRYEFLPNAVRIAQIFPPREEFVNLHENCFHLWEISDDEMREALLQNIIALQHGIERAVVALQGAIDNPKNKEKNMDYFKGKLVAYEEVHDIINDSFCLRKSEELK